MRLGFAVQVLGRPQLKAYDSRRWQNHPHLSVSLAYLRDVLSYLDSVGLHMYRLQSDLAPYATHPDLPEFHHQVEESAAELQHTGALARQLGMRLSFRRPPLHHAERRGRRHRPAQPARRGGAGGDPGWPGPG